MKKSTKLLSVILAIVMLFSSMTVLASAAKTNYKTHEDLVALNAYSPYGTVTRLSTEERTSMVFDTLDQLLGDLNLNPGKLFDVAGLSLNVDLRSINALCGTVDNVKSLLGNFLVTLVKPLLGILADVNLKRWTEGMTREGVNQLDIVAGLLMVLQDNAGVVGNVLSTGEIDLGVASSALSGVDLSIIKDIPGLIKGLIFPLLERKDDDLTQMGALASTQGNGGVQTVLNSFVKSLFTKPQSNTSYKENAEGVCISNHTLPTQDDYLRYAYEKGQDSTGEYYTFYVLDPVTYEYTAEEAKYYKTEEPVGSGEYVFKTAEGDNLKYYENDSYWLPSFANALSTGSATLDLETDSAATLLYKFAPYVFQEMAPVVLNGSVKKALAQWFGASFTYVGEVGSEEVTALPDSGNAFFTQEQGEYLWEWSDYAVINGNHYYRFQDQIYSSDLSNTNPYFDIINWDYKITDDFIDEFIPAAADGKTASAAGYTTVLQAANDFFGKVIETVFTPDVVSAIAWVDGDNSNLLENAKKAARYVVNYSPESIFGEDYNNGYYQLMMDEGSSNQEIVCGIAAKLIELLMPQFNLPSAENLKGKNVGGLFAAIIRELATQLLPTYNYDALIYSDYNNKILLDKDNSYWLDVCLTMGVDIGMNYLRNLIDLGEDTEVGYKFAASKTYDLTAFEADPQGWEDTVDWVVDWALCDDYEWTWKMEKFVDTSAFTIDLAAPQDPWPKLDAIIRAILPVEEILSVTPAEGKTWLETALRDNFVLSLLNLDIVTPVSMFNIPAGSVLRDTNVFSAVVEVVRNLLNGLLKKVAGGDLINASTITSIDSVFNQKNLAEFAQNLISKLYTAYQNGLLDVAMPILNFFVGWTTDAQKLAEPIITFTNANGYNYVYMGAAETISFTNASSGMLLKRPDGSYDKPYNIVIDNIVATNGTASFTPGQVVAPGASLPISFTANSEGPVTIAVEYHYTFKDGTELGEHQYAYNFNYATNAQPDMNKSWSDTHNNFFADRSNAQATPINPAITNLKSFKGTIESLVFVVTGTGGSGSSGSGTSYTGFDGNYIAYTGEAYNGVGNNEGVTIHPAKYTGADLSGITSGSAIALGTFKTTTKWGTSSHTYTANYGYLWYANIEPLQALYNSIYDAGYQRIYFDETADAEWNAYLAAMQNAAYYLFAPMTTSTFSTVYTQENLDNAADQLETAVENLLKKSTTAATVDVLEEALAQAENLDKEINYQDYRLHEYFEYQDERTATRNRIQEYTAPEAPDAYIEGCDLSEAEILEISAAAANSTLKDAIEKTLVQPSEADKDAYKAALAEYVYPTYTALDNANQAALLGYYKQFLIAKTTEKQFLAKEIAAANAQGYEEGNYSTDSWAAYSAALATANEVNSAPDALQSEVFNAKYNLMITQNQLMAKEDSAKDNGAYMQLESLIAQADVMFQNTDLYTVKEGEAADAWANLVAALGYEYEDENGDIQNLYVNSAKAYVASDRVMSSTTDAELASQVATLQDAINQFTCAITVVPDEDVPDNSTNVEQTELIIDGLVPATIASGEDLLALVKAAAPEGYNVTLESVASAAGYYGTGATVKANVAELGGQTVATYTVVIYGDVNGDGAVDAFDAAVLDLDLADVQALTGAYGLAADTNADAQVAVADYTLVKDAIAGTATINQVR